MDDFQNGVRVGGNTMCHSERAPSLQHPLTKEAEVASLVDSSLTGATAERPPVCITSKHQVELQSGFRGFSVIFLPPQTDRNRVAGR